jgi:hypothetical protein
MTTNPLITAQVSAATEKTSVVMLAAADILTLKTKPVTIVPAPGNGKMLVAEWVVIDYKFGTVAFTANNENGAGLYYGATANLAAFSVISGSTSGPMLDFTSSGDAICLGVGVFNGGLGATTRVNVNNAALVLQDTGSDYAAGNGSAKVTVRYLIVDLIT